MVRCHLSTILCGLSSQSQLHLLNLEFKLALNLYSSLYKRTVWLGISSERVGIYIYFCDQIY